MGKRHKQYIRFIVLNLVCSLAYFAFGKFGLLLASINENVSPFWPASGLALALAIRYGKKVLPGIFIGALLTNYSISWSGLFTASLIALGNTSEAHIGQIAWKWIQDKLKFLNELDSIFRISLLGLLAPISASLIGTFAIYSNISVLNFDFWESVATWWAGDMLGILSVYPLARYLLDQETSIKVTSFFRMISIGAGFGLISFFIFQIPISSSPVLIFPLLILCFLMFGELQTKFTLVFVVLATLYATTKNHGPFTSNSMNTSLMDLVLFLFSICLVSKALPRLLGNKFRDVAITSLGAGWLVMTVIFVVVVNSANEQDELRIKASLEKKIDDVQDRMKIYENALLSGAGLYQASNEVTPQEWRDFVIGTDILQNFPGIEGLGVIFRVPHKEENQFLSKVRNQWKIKDFRIKSVPNNLMKLENETGGENYFTRPIKDPDHYVITHIEPIEKNLSARGLDIGSELGRRTAAESSMKTNKFTITPPIVLIQKDQKGFGFLAYVPIRKKGVDAWVYAPFSSKEFFNQALRHDDQFYFKVYDSLPFGERTLIYSSEKKSKNLSWKNAKNSNLVLGGRNLQLEWLPNLDMFSTTSNSASWAGFLGVVFTLLLAGVVVGLKSSELKALELVELQTKDLNSKNSFLNNLMNLSPVGIFRTDIDGNAVFLNRQWLAIAGMELSKALGSGWEKSLHPADKPKVEKYWKSFMSGGKFELEYRFINQKTKKIHWVFGRAVRLENEDKQPQGFLGTIEDITEIKNQQQKLLESSRLSSLGEMAAGIAHEINNPLAIISGAASLLIERMDRDTIRTDEIKSYLEKIDSTSHRIAKIIRGLRAYAREGSNDPMEWTSLETILENTLSLCSEKFKVHGVDLNTQFDKSLMILCREIQISQVFINLLNNAYDAVCDSESPWIQISVVENEIELSIRVTDSGSGVSQLHTNDIMKPFFTTKEVGKGTGLGLSISSSIIEQHGGQLYLDQQSINTSFVVSLPKGSFRHNSNEDEKNTKRKQLS